MKNKEYFVMAVTPYEKRLIQKRRHKKEMRFLMRQRIRKMKGRFLKKMRYAFSKKIMKQKLIGFCIMLICLLILRWTWTAPDCGEVNFAIVLVAAFGALMVFSKRYMFTS